MSEYKTASRPYNDKVTIKVEQLHVCGQVIEQITHMTADHLLSLTVSSDPPLFFSDLDPTRPFTLPPPSKGKIKLAGHYDLVEFNGIEMKGHRLLCQKCGGDVLFPERDEQE